MTEYAHDPVGEVPRLALRPRDAAAALGISERTLWQLTSDGEIPHVRLRGCVVYPIAALQQRLDALATTEDAP